MCEVDELIQMIAIKNLIGWVTLSFISCFFFDRSPLCLISRSAPACCYCSMFHHGCSFQGSRCCYVVPLFETWEVVVTCNSTENYKRSHAPPWFGAQTPQLILGRCSWWWHLAPPHHWQVTKRHVAWSWLSRPFGLATVDGLWGELYCLGMSLLVVSHIIW